MSENTELAVWIFFLLMIVVAVKLLKILGMVEDSFANNLVEVPKPDVD